MKRSTCLSSRRRLSSFALLIGALACGAVTLSFGGAGKVLRVWPDEFEASVSVQHAQQLPVSIRPLYPLGTPSAPFTNVNFHRVLELRPGRELTGVTYHHAGFGPDAYTVVSLLRVTMGGHPVVLFTGSSQAVTTGPGQADIIPVDLTITSSDLVVHKDDRYYLTVNVDNDAAAVYGVDVSYK